jgi:hypothetical protein
MNHTQGALRDAFARWGLPLAMRLDNGYPWGNWSELPTALALWVAGLGVGLKFNPPRRPRHNGVVERSHGVSKAWAEVPTCASAEELQARIDDLDKIQRQEYRVRKGKSRWELFEGLRVKRREYSPQEADWREDLARRYLAGEVAMRQVDGQGKAKVYARAYYVGVVHKHKPCCVQYDPDEGAWVFGSLDGAQWCRHKAEQITAARIRALDVSAKPSRNHGQTSCPN